MSKSSLDGILLRRAVLDRVSHVRDVIALEQAVALIRTLVPSATDEALAQSLDALGTSKASPRSRARSLSAWALTWLGRMERAPVRSPLVDDPTFRILVGEDMLEAGRRYRTCLAQRVAHVALGKRLYHEWVGPDSRAIMELRCLRDGAGYPYFVAGEIRGIGNTRLLPSVIAAILSRLADRGVLFDGVTTRQGAASSMLDVHELGDDYGLGSYHDALEDIPELAEVEAA